MRLAPSDLLAIFVGATVVDAAFLALNYAGALPSRELTRWYTSLGPSAMAMDILVIGLATAIGVYVARALFASPNLWQAALCVVGVQMVHDVLFALLFQTAPRGVFIFDVFKKYAAEVGAHALWADALMVVGTLLLAEGVARLPRPVQQGALLASVYVALYALYAKRPDALGTPLN